MINLKKILTTALLVMVLIHTVGHGFLSYTMKTDTSTNPGGAFENHSTLFYVLAGLHVVTFGLAGAVMYKA